MKLVKAKIGMKVRGYLNNGSRIDGVIDQITKER